MAWAKDEVAHAALADLGPHLLMDAVEAFRHRAWTLCDIRGRTRTSVRAALRQGDAWGASRAHGGRPNAAAKDGVWSLSEERLCLEVDPDRWNEMGHGKRKNLLLLGWQSQGSGRRLLATVPVLSRAAHIQGVRRCRLARDQAHPIIIGIAVDPGAHLVHRGHIPGRLDSTRPALGGRHRRSGAAVLHDVNVFALKASGGPLFQRELAAR
mmetsp:Transcript_7917/g.18368  ORF Transcript_7917/g.18368 Transcript_7917/m.18368 type:complete len:210 (+) Transcript_7917:221-850(+)